MITAEIRKSELSNELTPEKSLMELEFIFNRARESLLCRPSLDRGIFGKYMEDKFIEIDKNTGIKTINNSILTSYLRENMHPSNLIQQKDIVNKLFEVGDYLKKNGSKRLISTSLESSISEYALDTDKKRIRLKPGLLEIQYDMTGKTGFWLLLDEAGRLGININYKYMCWSINDKPIDELKLPETIIVNHYLGKILQK